MKDKKIKILCLSGKAGTGKDTILKSLSQLGLNFNKIISYTSRPQRENEIDGQDYYFITHEDFLSKIQNEEMLEYTEFNGWFYGIGKDCLSENMWNIGILTPSGIQTLREYDNLEVIIFPIIASDKIRLIRQLEREQDPNIDEIIRRYKADQIDFDNSLYSLQHGNLNNNYSDLAKILTQLAEFLRTNPIN